MKYVLDSYVGIKWLIQVAFEASGKEDRFVMVGRRNGYASSISIGLGLPGSFQTQGCTSPRGRLGCLHRSIPRRHEGDGGRDSDVGKTKCFRRHPGIDPLHGGDGGIDPPAALPAVIPQMTSQAVKSFAPVGDRSPAASVQAEVQSTGGRIDGLERPISRPAEGTSRLEDREDRLRECDLTAERGMHRVLKESIVEEAVTANRMKIRLSVDR